MDKKQIEFAEKKEALFQVLVQNQGIQRLLDTAYLYLENTIAVVDASFTVIASCSIGENDIMIETAENKKFIRFSALQHMNEEKLIDQIYQSHSAFVFQSIYLSGKMIFSPVLVNGVFVAYVAVFEQNRPLENEDLPIVDALCEMLSLEMQKSQFYSFSTKQKYEYLISELLSGRVDNETIFIERLKHLGRTLKKNLWLILLPLPYNTLNNYIEFSFQQLHEIFPEDLIITYKRAMVMIVSKDEPYPLKKFEKKRLGEFLRQRSMTAFLSFRCKSILEIPNQYDQMVVLLRRIDISKFPPVQYYFEDYVLESIFSYCEDANKLRTCIHPDIMELKDYDKTYNSNLLGTLRAYLEHNRNAVNAAKFCNIHKSTFFYRMGKIKEITGVDLQDCKKLQLYEVSFKIMDYLNKI